jgi:hypothetical protein
VAFSAFAAALRQTVFAVSSFQESFAMPQPLSRVNPNAGVVIGNAGDYPLERNPNLLRLSMRVMTAWATLETFITSIFVAILGDNARLGVAIYSSLIAESAQLAAFRAGADIALETRPRERELLEAILRIHKTLGKQRNKVAHWISGYSPELPEATLLTPPAVLIKLQLDTQAYLDNAMEKGIPSAGPSPKPDLDAIYVYEASDFESTIAQIERLSGHCLKFRRLLRTSGAVTDHEYDRLSRAPDIAPALARLRAQKTLPSGPQQQPPTPPPAADL